MATKTVGKKLLQIDKNTKPMPSSLRQRMAKAVSPARPSMLPDFTPVVPITKGKVEKDVKPDITELLEEGEDRRELRTLIVEQSRINGQIKALTAELKPYNESIKKLLDKYGIDSMLCDGLPVAYFPGNRSTIDGTLLLAAGVPAETIELCTKVSSSRSLVIGKAKEE